MLEGEVPQLEGGVSMAGRLGRHCTAQRHQMPDRVQEEYSKRLFEEACRNLPSKSLQVPALPV